MDVITFPVNRFYCMALFHSQTRRHMIKCYLLYTQLDIEGSWLLFVMFTFVFVTFPCGIQGQVLYLIISIPDLCHLSYFYELGILKKKAKHTHN